MTAHCDKLQYRRPHQLTTVTWRGPRALQVPTRCGALSDASCSVAQQAACDPSLRWPKAGIQGALLGQVRISACLRADTEPPTLAAPALGTANWLPSGFAHEGSSRGRRRFSRTQVRLYSPFVRLETPKVVPRCAAGRLNGPAD